MDLLARINGQLVARISQLERRLAQLEGAPVSDAPPFEPSPEPGPEPPPVKQAEPPSSDIPFTPLPFEPIPETPILPASQPHPSAETSFGLNWLNRIGAFTLILAAAFFFKFAVDNNWIGPTGRVLLGLATGFALLAAAHFLNTRGHALFSQGLAGAGVSVLYLSFWAASSLYQLIPAAAAAVALVAVTALAGALAYRTRALALAALGLIGAYITPPALSTGEYHPYILFTYLLLINAAWLTFARFMGWRLLEFIALPATFLLGGAVFADLQTADRSLAGSYFLFSQYAVFVFSRFAPFVHIAQIAAALGLLFAWRDDPRGFAIAAFILLSISLIAAHRLAVPALALTAAAACAASYGLTIVLGSSSSTTLFLGALAAFAIAHSFLPCRLARGHSPGRAELALQPLNAVAIFAAGYNFLHGRHDPWLGLFAASLGAVYLVTGLLLRRNLPNLPGITNAVLLSAGAAIALLTAAIPLQFDGFRITVLWALEAAALAWIARRIDSQHARFSALAVCVLTAVRLLVIDLSIYPDPSTYSLLINARFTTFLLSAAGFAAAAWWLRPGSLAIPPYLAAHSALLLGLALEVTAHVRRLTPPADLFSAEMVSLSILLAAYALALVATGVATRTRGNRLLGLALLAVVIVKLYAVDVWAMHRVYRIVAFSALGVLLLSTSFLYSRFRAKIEALLQDEDR